LGFLGIKKKVKYDQLFIPHKGSKKQPLSEIQKDENCTYLPVRQAGSRIRVGIENVFAKIKSFFVLRIE
jgi:hypothetical protein